MSLYNNSGIQDINCSALRLGFRDKPLPGENIDIRSSTQGSLITINGIVPGTGGGGGGGDVTQIGNNVFTGTNKFDNMNGIVVANDILFEDKLTALTPGVPEFKILFNDGTEGAFNTGINCCFIAKVGQEDDFGLATDCIKYIGAPGAQELFLVWNEATGLITAVDNPSGGGGIPIGTALLLAAGLGLQTVASPVFFSDTGGIQIRNKIELVSGVNPGTAKIEIDHRFFPTSNIPVHHLAVVPSSETAQPAEAYINTLFRNSKLLVPLGNIPAPATPSVTGEPMNKVLGWNDSTGEVSFSDELKFTTTPTTFIDTSILDSDKLSITKLNAAPIGLESNTVTAAGMNLQNNFTGPTTTFSLTSTNISFSSEASSINLGPNNIILEYNRSVTEYRTQAQFTVIVGAGQSSTSNILFNFNTTLFKTYKNGVATTALAQPLNAIGMGTGTLSERIYNMTCTFVTDLTGSEGYMPTGAAAGGNGYENLKCYSTGITNGNSIGTSIAAPVELDVDGVKWVSDRSTIKIAPSNSIVFPIIQREHLSLPTNFSTYRLQMPQTPIAFPSGGTATVNISLTQDSKSYKYGGFMS